MEQTEGQQSFDSQGEQEYGIHRCSFHPDVETGLSCGRCGNYICPRCMIQTSVGARCRDCARMSRPPTYDARPTHYVQAIFAGLTSGVVAGLIWWALSMFISGLIISAIIAIAVGYVIGEIVSIASNRKRTPILSIVAGISTITAVLVSGFLYISYLPLIVLHLLIAGIAVYIAVRRVRP